MFRISLTPRNVRVRAGYSSFSLEPNNPIGIRINKKKYQPVTRPIIVKTAAII
ncbi:MAG TPA: hypothetical protein VJ973_00495 [Christiangramia sp.]|nr:hypothetical protein [Christiangramia sp.]